MEGSGSSGPAHASSTVSDVCEMEEIVASDGLGADSQACAEMRAPGSESALGKRGIDEVDMAGMLLTPLQQQVLQRIVDELDTKSTSVVVTNPLRKDNPIVYVTEPWQDMCGFSAAQAHGRNPRLTQGSKSDPAAMRDISSALQEERACKALMLNYRSGLPDQPFWNMLSINPVRHAGRLMLYVASLQDYSYQMAQLVSLTPSQFCRSAEHHQRQRRLEALARPSHLLGKPTIFEADDATALHFPATASAAVAPLMPVKRLGWTKLELEPEHLSDRVVDALVRMDASYELSETRTHSSEVFVVAAKVKGVACRVIVSEDESDGSYRISCMRVGGDTFAYHEIFRELRQLLGVGLTSTKSPAPRPACALGLAPLGLARGSAPLDAAALGEGTGPSPSDFGTPPPSTDDRQ